MTALGQYKNNPTLTLNAEEPDLRRRFTFGADKARMILANLEAIRAFAEANPPKRRATPPGSLEAENARLARELETLRAQVNARTVTSTPQQAPSAPADILNHIRG